MSHNDVSKIPLDVNSSISEVFSAWETIQRGRPVSFPLIKCSQEDVGMFVERVNEANGPCVVSYVYHRLLFNGCYEVVLRELGTLTLKKYKDVSWGEGFGIDNKVRFTYRFKRLTDAFWF